MKVPESLIAKWKTLQSHGDITRIAEASGISINTIWKAFEKWECSPKTLDAIAEFYAERESTLSDYME